MLHQPVAIFLGQVDDFWNEQHLGSRSFRVQRRAHLLEHKPLVGGVLIDDDKAALRLRDDVVFVQLRPRGPKREARRLRSCGRSLVHFLWLRPRGGHGHVVKARLARFRKLHVAGNGKRP